MLGFNLRDAFHKAAAKVTKLGELVVAPLSYEQTSFQNMSTTNAYNFYGPVSKQQFIVTSVIVFADRSVNDANSTIITIYEASSATSTTVDKVILQFGMGKLTALPIVPVRLEVTGGKYLNAKTDDNNILLNIVGYYVDRVDI